mgnify:CR=1 FL=1
MEWSVYIILCADNTLYTGITTDIRRRYGRHAARQGAKYFHGRSPQRLVYLETGHNRSSAGKRECAIKKMARPDKLRLLSSELNKVNELTL